MRNPALKETQRAIILPKVHVSSTEPRRVAVGLGSCLDSVTTAVQLFDRISVQPPAGEDVKHHDSLRSARELAEGFTYFFTRGAAAERYVHDKLLFKRLVAAARDMPEAKWTIGGNAPVMANRMAREGCQVLLGSVISDTIAKEIETGVKVTSHSTDQEVEEVHMILEYKTGETWGSFSAPRANRFIVHSDASNPLLSSLESFQEQLKPFKPHAVVIGGLQMMDNFPFKGDVRSQRLGLLRNVLTRDVPTDIPIHFEFASFVEQATALDVINHVVLYADSLGMNEQELPNLYSLLNYGNISVVSDPYPRVATVLDQMRSVYRSLRTVRGPSMRALTRLHVHTLAFQAILTTKNSKWKNTMAAAAKASLTAYRHVCGSDHIEVAKAHLIMDDSFSLSRQEGSDRVLFQNHRPVSCWEEEDYQICLAPVLVCTQVRKTAGGGDNISAAALAAQI
ncbi:ADP-dependent glucokinase-like isoform X2 [Acanthaster planci]|uniref:ADP-dependent glucokinase-like isoform X2 n=1 Tax=Acanthaster planci TaxID=133434 RepID=A0A8B7YXV5_ACAPL|nr:ADP-dependent glucokinase-like isoform X2 [Acanthaster planci]